MCLLAREENREVYISGLADFVVSEKKQTSATCRQFDPRYSQDMSSVGLWNSVHQPALYQL